MKKWVGVVVGIAAFAALAFAQQFEYHGDQDPWWRPLNPAGQSYGVTYGNTRPTSPADGEIFVDMDGDTDGGAVIEIYDGVNAEWNTYLDNDETFVSGTANTIAKFATATSVGDSSVTDDGTTVDLTVANIAFTANTVTSDNAFNITSSGALNLTTAGGSELKIVAGGNLDLDMDTPSANTNMIEFASNIPLTAGGETTSFLVLEFGSEGDHTGGNINALDIDTITGDDDAAETAINIGAGWDVALQIDDGTVSDDVICLGASGCSTDAAIYWNSGSQLVFEVDGATNDVSFKLSGASDAFFEVRADSNANEFQFFVDNPTNSGVNYFEVNIQNSSGVNGSDTTNLLLIDWNDTSYATGTGNVTNGLSIETITQEQEVLEVGIDIGTGWEIAMQANAPINGAGVYDDFTDFAVLQTDDTAESSTDAEENFIYTGAPGVPGGVYIMRVEKNASQALTQHAGNGGLLFAPDYTSNEGLEVAFTPNELTGPFTFGENSGDIYMEISLTIANISAIDGDFFVGLRNNTAFADPPTIGNTYVSYTLSDNAGDLDIECDLNAGGSANDDTGTTWADTETHVLRLEVDSTGLLTAAYVDESSVTITNCGASGNEFESGDKILPYLAFTVGAEGVDPGVQINYISYGEIQS